MTEEKLILKKEKEAKATMPVFIDVAQHAQLLELKNETGIPLRRIVSKFIDYGFSHLEIIDGDE